MVLILGDENLLGVSTKPALGRATILSTVRLMNMRPFLPPHNKAQSENLLISWTPPFYTLSIHHDGKAFVLRKEKQQK